MSDLSIAQICNTVLLVTGLIIGYLKYRDLRDGQKDHTDKLDAVHNEMNGMKDALIKNAGTIGKAEGAAEQRAKDAAMNDTGTIPS